LPDCLGRRASLEVSYAFWQRLRAFALDSVPEECNFCGSEDTFAGAEQDPVGLYLPEEGPEVTLVLLR